MGLGGVLLESAGCGLEGGAACLDGAALGGLPAFFLAAAAAEAFGGVASGVAEGSAEGCIWKKRARHCWAVRAAICLEMSDHCRPWSLCSRSSALSSCADQASRLMLGSRWRRQRPMHCWSVRPGQRRAMSAQRGPISATSASSTRSSSSLHFSLRMFGFTLCRQRCAHCWPVRPGICSATVDHRLPTLACISASSASSSSVQAPVLIGSPLAARPPWR
mmetsp:Transcript_38293/g.97906  ORF Transcript_38293/g.97906 Transcript_38293/m.97906 type:complete len:219 (+) Transcript_38293:1494-2150(+)